MANEITALQGNNGSYTLLFLFPIASPAQAGGANIVEKASASLPAHAQAILSQAEKDAIDDGTLAWEAIDFQTSPGMTNPQLAARAREMYASRKAAFATEYASRNRWLGQRLNEA